MFRPDVTKPLEDIPKNPMDMPYSEFDFKVRHLWHDIQRRAEKGDESSSSTEEETKSDREYEEKRQKEKKEKAITMKKLMRKVYKAGMNDYEMFLFHMGLTIKMDKNTTKNRCFTATKDIDSSHILFREKPYIFVAQPNICSNCWHQKLAKQLQACTQCNYARYCSKDCQKQDWRNKHKFRCKAIKNSKITFNEFRFKFPQILIVAELLYKIYFEKNVIDDEVFMYIYISV